MAAAATVAATATTKFFPGAAGTSGSRSLKNKAGAAPAGVAAAGAKAKIVCIS